MTYSNSARVLVDEDLSPRFVRLLQTLQYDIDRVPQGAKDVDIISSLGTAHGSNGVWITADRAAITEHREDILMAGISVAFLNVHNARRDTQCFMIFSFVYRRGHMTRSSDVPLYFKLDMRTSPDGPNVAISRFAL